MIFTEAEVNIIYLGTIDPYINRNESVIVLLYETVINVLWAMFCELALNTTCVFFGVNFNGNKKDLCILQRLFRSFQRSLWNVILTSHDAKIKSRGFPISASCEVNITFQRLLWLRKYL